MFFSYSNSYTQTCLPEGIRFWHQFQVDNFQYNYPCCNTRGEVEEICGVGIIENDDRIKLSVYPNPTSNSSKFKVQSAKLQLVELKVFSLQGRKIAVIFKDYLKAGEHDFDFDASNLSPGLYFYRLTANGQTTNGKLVVVKY